MKSILVAAITCSILFGASYAASTYFLNQDAGELADEEGDAEAVEGAEDAESDDSSGGTQFARVDDGLPVPIRPEQAVSLEAILNISDSIEKREELLMQREEEIAKEEQRVMLLFRDLETERDELQAFSDGIDTRIESLNAMGAAMRQLLDDLDQRKIEVAALERNAGVDDESQRQEMYNRVNEVKDWFESLEAEQAARYLKDMANNGKLDFVAALLDRMPTRQKTKIVAAIDDEVLIGQLIRALHIEPVEINRN
ncbi:MAG: hypothetical protein AAF456_07890 [Planctomycetota bacterium]